MKLYENLGAYTDDPFVLLHVVPGDPKWVSLTYHCTEEQFVGAFESTDS